MDLDISLPQVCRDALDGRLDPGLFKALADNHRLTLLGRLAVCPDGLRVSELAEQVDVHLSVVSRHLTQLRRAGVVTADKRGREVVYRLDCGALAQTLRGIADALDDCAAACCSTGESTCC